MFKRPSLVSSSGPPSATLPVKALKKGVNNESAFVRKIHEEFTKHKRHALYVWPFLLPVDPDVLGIPHYKEIITSPMDLGTMTFKLKEGSYHSAVEYETDFRLFLSNCFKFNPPDHDVYKTGKLLEEAFNRRWSEMSRFLTGVNSTSSSSSSTATTPISTPTPHFGSHSGGGAAGGGGGGVRPSARVSTSWGNAIGGDSMSSTGGGTEDQPSGSTVKSGPVKKRKRSSPKPSVPVSLPPSVSSEEPSDSDSSSGEGESTLFSTECVLVSERNIFFSFTFIVISLFCWIPSPCLPISLFISFFSFLSLSLSPLLCLSFSPFLPRRLSSRPDVRWHRHDSCPSKKCS